MGIIIDGLNLIYKFPELESLMYINRLNDARKGLIDMLKQYHRIKPVEIRVVFDGKRNQGDTTLQEKLGPIKVYYSHDYTADHLIKEFIKQDKNPRMTTVVTSDKEIISYVNRFKAVVVRSEEFSSHVTKTIEEEGRPIIPEKEVDPVLSQEEISFWEKMFRKKNG